MPHEPLKGPSSPRRGRPKAGGGEGRGVNVNFRCSAAWRDWLARFAEKEGVKVPDLLASAAEVYSRLQRFEAPPER